MRLHSVFSSTSILVGTLVLLPLSRGHASELLTPMGDRVPPEVILGVLPTATPDRPLHLEGYVRDLGEIESVRYSLNGFVVASPTPGADGEVAADVTLADGLNTIVLEAIDADGNRGRAEALVSLDTNAPRVRLDSSAPRLGTPWVRLAGEISAPNGIASARVLVDGALVAWPRPAEDGSFGLTVPLVEGRHEVVVAAESRSLWVPLVGYVPGVPVELRWPLVVDTVPPTIELTDVPELSPSSRVVVRGRLSDATSGIERAEVSVDGEPFRRIALFADGTFEHELWLGEGTHDVRISAFDRSGNEGVAAASVDVDSLPPTVRVLRPAAGAVTADSVAEVELEVLDRSVTRAFIADAVSVLPAGGGRAFGRIPLGAEGPQRLEVAVRDDAGNLSTVPIEVVRDLSAPVLTSDLADGLALGPLPGAGLPFVVRVEELTATTVVMPSRTTVLPAGGGEVADTVPLFEGWNALTASATDELGHAAALTRTAVYDLTPPELEPVFDPSVPVRGRIELAVRATDALTGVARVSSRIAGAEHPLTDHGGGRYVLALDTTALADGPLALTLDASDGVGHRRSVEATLEVDNTPPVVDRMAPVAGTQVGGIVAVSATVSDARSGVVRIDLSAAGLPIATCDAVSSCAGELDTRNLPDGPFAVVARALDRAGNASVQSWALVSDNTAPERFLLAPSTGDVVRGELVVALSVDDAGHHRAECSVDGVALEPSSDPRARWTFDTSGLFDGAVTVRCTATDLAGNSRTESTSITLDNWQERFAPVRLALDRTRGKGDAGAVEMRLEGPNVGIVLPALESLALWIDGAAPVSGAEGDLREATEHGTTELRVRFSRKQLTRAAAAAVEAGATSSGVPVPIRLLAGERVIATDEVVLDPGRRR